MSGPSRRRQSGIALIEAMIAVLIFALGILGLVAMGGTAMASQTDARLRTDAAMLASDISNQIALSVPHNVLDPVAALVVQTKLLTYVHNPGGATCNFNGGASAAQEVIDWAAKINGTGPSRLPGASASGEQILVTPGVNRVQVTVCWKSAADAAPRHHTLVTYVD